jgi:basic amino acid/polyamine antiporter, APA family
VTAGQTKSLGTLSLLALGVNGIVGVGIFFAPAEIAQLAPKGASVLVVAATGAALVPVALAVATLGGRFHADGGPVLYARHAFGDSIGFVVGWLAYVSSLFSTAAIVAGLTRAVLPAIYTHPVALRGAALFVLSAVTVACIAGLQFSARAWTALTFLKLVPLVALVAVAVTSAAPGGAPLIAPAGDVSWLRAALLTTFVYQGFEIVPVVAGHAKAPSRTIPIAVVGSLAIATLLYIAVQRATVTAVPGLASSPSPLVDAAFVYGGSRFAEVLRAGASVSALGIALGMMVTTPRYLAALARGTRFSLTSPNGVPRAALFMTWLAVAVIVSLGSLAELFVLSSLAVVTQYLLVALALARIGWRRELGLTPARAWSAAPTIVVSVVLLGAATSREWIVAVGFLAAGLALRRMMPSLQD